MISTHTYTVTVQAVTKLDHAESDVNEHLQKYLEMACTALRQQLSGNLQINTIRVDDSATMFPSVVHDCCVQVEAVRALFADERIAYYGYDEVGYAKHQAWQSIRDEVLAVL